MIINKLPPDSARPTGVDLQVLDDPVNEDILREMLLKGGIDAAWYYGCWCIWKDGDAYNGELMQYRSLTDSFTKATLDEAVEKAEKWSSATYG